MTRVVQITLHQEVAGLVPAVDGEVVDSEAEQDAAVQELNYLIMLVKLTRMNLREAPLLKSIISLSRKSEGNKVFICIKGGRKCPKRSIN